MTLLFLSALAIFSWQTSSAPRQLVNCSTHRIEIPAMLMNSSTLPVRLDSARAECSLGESSLDYSVVNTSKQQIQRIEFRIFILDPAGKVLEVKEGISATKIKGGSTQLDRVIIKGMLERTSQLLFAVNKVITEAGVWQIDDPSLDALVRKQLFAQPDTGISATFEANAIVSGLERGQIFKLSWAT